MRVQEHFCYILMDYREEIEVRLWHTQHLKSVYQRNTKKSATPSSMMLIDPLVLKKKINKIGNPGECAVLSSLLCYIISLDGSDATKGTTEELPIKVLKTKAQNKIQEPPNSKKPIRPSRFQLLQSKFLNPNHEPPMKKLKEVGKLTFKEKETVPRSTRSIVKKLDAAKLKVGKEERLENDLHFRTDKNQWNKVTGKGRVKSILNKFAAAEEKENKHIQQMDSKKNAPKMNSRGTIIDTLKQKFEQNPTICSVKVVKPSQVPKEQTVKKEIPTHIKHSRQAKDHVTHSTLMAATCLETPVLEYAELSEQTIHTFQPTSMITKVYTLEAPKPSSKEIDTGEQLGQNDKHNQEVCVNFCSSTTGRKQIDMEVNYKRVTDGKTKEKVTVQNHSLAIPGVGGHCEVKPSKETDLPAEKGYYDKTDQVPKQSSVDNKSRAHVDASCKDSIPNNISDKVLKYGVNTECELSDGRKICDTTSKHVSEGNNVKCSVKDKENKNVPNAKPNINSYTIFQCSNTNENNDNTFVCLDTGDPIQLNVHGIQNDSCHTESLQWTEKEDGSSNTKTMTMFPEVNVSSCGTQEDSSKWAEKENKDTMSMCQELDVSTYGIQNYSSHTEKLPSTSKQADNSNTEGPHYPNESICATQSETNSTKISQWADNEDENNNTENMSIYVNSQRSTQPPTEKQNDNEFTGPTKNLDYNDNKKVLLVASNDRMSSLLHKNTERMMGIPRKAITDPTMKTPELFPQRASHQSSGGSNTIICKDGNITLEPKYEKCCEFYLHKHLPRVIPSIPSLTDEATFTIEPYVSLEMALKKEIKVQQSISVPRFEKETEKLNNKKSSQTETLNSCTAPQILKPIVLPKTNQWNKSLNQSELSDFGGKVTSKSQIPLPNELYGEQGSFSRNSKRHDVLEYVKQPEVMKDNQLEALINDPKLSLSAYNALKNRHGNQQLKTTEASFYKNKGSEDTMTKMASTDHLSESVNGTSRKENLKSELSSLIDHPSDQCPVMSGEHRSSNVNFDNIEKANESSITSRTEMPTKTISKGKVESPRHSEGNAADRRATSKYQIPSPRDLTNDQHNKACPTQKTKPNNDISKYKVQSYKDTEISKQLFKPLVVRVCDTFKHDT